MTLACCLYLHRHIWPSEWPWEVQSALIELGKPRHRSPFEVWAKARTKRFPSTLLCSLKHVYLRGVFQVFLLPLVRQRAWLCPEQGRRPTAHASQQPAGPPSPNGAVLCIIRGDLEGKKGIPGPLFFPSLVESWLTHLRQWRGSS